MQSCPQTQHNSSINNRNISNNIIIISNSSQQILSLPLLQCLPHNILHWQCSKQSHSNDNLLSIFHLYSMTFASNSLVLDLTSPSWWSVSLHPRLCLTQPLLERSRYCHCNHQGWCYCTSSSCNLLCMPLSYCMVSPSWLSVSICLPLSLSLPLLLLPL